VALEFPIATSHSFDGCSPRYPDFEWSSTLTSIAAQGFGPANRGILLEASKVEVVKRTADSESTCPCDTSSARAPAKKKARVKPDSRLRAWFIAGSGIAAGQDHPIRVELQLCHLARAQEPVVEFGRLFRDGEGQCRFGEDRNLAANRAMGGQPTRSSEALRDDFLTCQT